jgi:hypothetical protein
MGKELKVHKVNDIPSTIEPDSLYLHKDSEGYLLVSQTDKQGVIAFTTMSAQNVFSLVDQKLADSPVISGARTLNLSQTSTYTITNYNAATKYTATAISGEIFIEEDKQINFTFLFKEIALSFLLITQVLIESGTC